MDEPDNLSDLIYYEDEEVIEIIAEIEDSEQLLCTGEHDILQPPDPEENYNILENIIAETQDDKTEDDDNNDPDYVPPDTAEHLLFSDPEENNISENIAQIEDNEDDLDILNCETPNTSEQTPTEGPSRRTRRKRRQVNTRDWVRNDRTEKREHGLSYKGVRKKKNNDGEIEWNYNVEKTARKLKAACDCTSSSKRKALQCRFITEDSRKKLHEHFWNLSWQEKKVYVCCLVDIQQTSRHRDRKDDIDESRRTFSLAYHLRVEEKRFHVCKTMFINTLSIGEWSVRNWKLQQSGEDGNEISPPTKKQRLTAVTDRRNALREWFHGLAKLESHYCRSSSSKLYLEPLWQNKAEIYRCYVQEMAQKSVQTVSIAVFHEEFDNLNLKLFRPKKDECDVCVSHKLGTISEQVFNDHRLRADEARAQKEIDKTDKTFDHMFMVDVQAVLLAPKNNVSSMYYKTKLCVHNYSILDVRTHQGTLYVWHESNGGLIADVFASMLCSHLRDNTKPGETVLIYSDGCPYQNRNCTMAAALSNLASEKQIVIIHKYLEPGHTQMEVDAIHSTVEHKIRGRNINIPADYVSLMEEAKIRNPKYKVHYLDYTFFKSFKEVGCNVVSIRPPPAVTPKSPKNVNEQSATAPYVTEIRSLKYFPNGDVFYKLRHPDEYSSLKPQRLRRKSTQPERVVKNFEDLTPLYTAPIPIKKTKFDHLQQLKSCIPSDYHQFYDNLPHC